jgi:hypothetical protein
MGKLASSSLQDYFATLTAPRCPYAPNNRHLLMDMLFIAVCAVICGAEGWVVYLVIAGNLDGPVAAPLRVVHEPLMSIPIGVSRPRPALSACLRAHLARVASR